MFNHNQGMEGERGQYRMRCEDKVKIVVKASRRALASFAFLHLPTLFSNLCLRIGSKWMQACPLSEILLLRLRGFVILWYARCLLHHVLQTNKNQFYFLRDKIWKRGLGMRIIYLLYIMIPQKIYWMIQGYKNTNNIIDTIIYE